MSDKYRRVRRVIRETAAGKFDRVAAVEHPKMFSTVMNEHGQLVNHWYGVSLAAEALKKAKQGVK